MEDKKPYRSLFWPILLIVAGLDLLFGRISPLVGAIIGVLAIIFIGVVLFAAPALGITAASQVVTERFVEPLGQATSATILLDLSSPRTTVHSITGTDALLDATLDHVGDISLSSSGVENRRVTLRRTGTSSNWFDTVGSGPMNWDIGLTADIPIDLTIDSASGGGNFELYDLMLTRLIVNSGSGSIQLSLPSAEENYAARIDSGSGSVEVDLPCSNIELRLNAGSGRVRINPPEGCPVRVEVLHGGSGSVNIGGDLDQVSGDNDEGVWETDDYSSATERLLIVMEDQGSGSFHVR